MEYFVLFLEGIATFISPCLLPMLPIYISYFAGQRSDNKYKVLINSIAFVIGFTIIFILLGVLSGTVGVFIRKHIDIINVIFGFIIILFGLNYMELLNIRLLNYTKKLNLKIKGMGVFASFIFGISFSIGWTPCIGAFLGSALLIATTQAELLKGMLMLLCYSIGLGIPFIISAVLIDKLKTTFEFIKRNYKTINMICGIFLILIGILMITGLMQKLLLVFNI